MRAILPYYGWKICFVIFGIQYFYYLLGSTVCASRFLSMVRVDSKCSGDALFELQIGNISHGQEDFVYLYGTFLEVQYNPQLMHGAFVDDEVIHRCSEAWLILYNVRCKMHLFVAREIHKGYFDVTHLVRDNGAVGSTPRLWSSPPNNQDAFRSSFFNKKEVITQPGVKQDSNCLSLDNQPLAVVFFMLASAN